MAVADPWESVILDPGPRPIYFNPYSFPFHPDEPLTIGDSMSIAEKGRLSGALDAESTDRIVFSGETQTGFISVDMPFISHIYGNFYQGGVEEGVHLPLHIEYVISLYRSEKYRILHQLKAHKSYSMLDSLGQPLTQVDEIARKAYEYGQLGHVLIHCQAGLNRSGLVMSRVLQMSGLTAEESVAMIREKRSPYCLINKHFEDWTLATPIDRAGEAQG
jgi:protein-tyrosine phosphatase